MRGLLLASLVLVAACGDDPPKKYSSYQLCFDDVKNNESLEAPETIVKCCLEHEVMGMPAPVCGATEPDCINYLTANLKQTDADITVKMQACADYVAQKSM